MQTTQLTKKLNVPILLGGLGLAWIGWAYLTAPPPPVGVDLRAQRQQNADEIASALVAQEKAEQMAAIAEQRYQAGCVPVFSDKDTTQGVQIALGVPILDYNTKKPLAPGTLVCDTAGNTAMVGEEGKPKEIAFTGKREVIDQRLREVNLKPAQTTQQQ